MASASPACASSAARRTSTRQLERTIARFFGTEDAILYSSCFDANGGLFETILGEEDAIISDALNHASIIDGIRLCKAERHRYPNGDMAALEEMLRKTQDKRLRLIATDGVFSMDGYLAKLDTICDLADKYRAMVMVDDSHATGFIGPTGRGTPEECGVHAPRRRDHLHPRQGAGRGERRLHDRPASEIIDLLRQRSRPYLFSNTLAPAIAGASIAVFNLIDKRGRPPREADGQHAPLPPGDDAGRLHHPARHPPHRAHHAGRRQARGRHGGRPLLAEGIYVIGFSSPGRAQRGRPASGCSSAPRTSREHVDQAIVRAFTKVGQAVRRDQLDAPGGGSRAEAYRAVRRSADALGSRAGGRRAVRRARARGSRAGGCRAVRRRRTADGCMASGCSSS